MTPTTISDDQILDGTKRMVIGPPKDRDLTGDIRAVEMCVELDENSVPKFSARFVATDEERQRIADGSPIWLTLWGHVVPFSLDLEEAE